VDEAEASGQAWRDKVRSRFTVERNKAALGNFIDYDADPYEVELYELASDPRMLLIDRAQRSRAGQHARHERRRRDQVKHATADSNGDSNGSNQRQPPAHLSHPPTSADSTAPG